MKRSLFVVIAIAFATLTSYSQATYDDMMGKLKGGDTSIDFKQVRMAYADKVSSDARVPDLKQHALLLSQFNEKKFKEAVKTAEGIHKTHFLDMNSHVVASMAYQGLGDAKKAKFHEAIYLGLVNSILNGGDGNSPKTAYQVISIAEEYSVLDALELKRGTQAVETADGKTFHVLSVTEKATNQPVKVYFNIDRIKPSLAAVPN